MDDKHLNIVLLSHSHFENIINHLLANNIVIKGKSSTIANDNCPTAMLLLCISCSIKSIEVCDIISKYCSSNRINYYSVICQAPYDTAYLPSNINLAYLPSFKPKRKIGFTQSHLRLIEGFKDGPLEAS